MPTLQECIEQYNEIDAELTALHSNMADGQLREKTYKARRMLLLLSFVLLIRSMGAEVIKPTLLGSEIKGLNDVLPQMTLYMSLYFALQFFLYLYQDRQRWKFLHHQLDKNLGKLAILTDDFDAILSHTTWDEKANAKVHLKSINNLYSDYNILKKLMESKIIGMLMCLSCFGVVQIFCT